MSAGDAVAAILRGVLLHEADVASGMVEDASMSQRDPVGHAEAGKLVAQAARLLAAPPRNPFGERTGGAS